MKQNEEVKGEKKGVDEVQLPTKREINWFKLLFHIQLALNFLCGVHFAVYEASWRTLFFYLLLVFLGTIGLTAGCHRLWTHRSYTASAGLRVFLMLCSVLVGNGTIYDWVRCHRLHHKFYGTDLDPFNNNKGFLYAHVTANVKDLSPAQQKKLEEIDMSDIEADKIVMFQKKFYYVLLFFIGFLLPVNAPAEYWGEHVFTSIFVVGWLRYATLVHTSCLIYSGTRIWNLQDGEKFPCDTNWVFVITKTYWLSYHYLVPWDYQTGEFGKYGTDMTSAFIRVCAALELATDLKTVDSHAVRQALDKSVTEERPVGECLIEIREKSKTVPDDHFLTPAKYCYSAAY